MLILLSGISILAAGVLGQPAKTLPIQVPVLVNAVTIDGKITDSNEWSDASKTTLTLQCEDWSCTEAPVSELEAVIWAKHDDNWLYLLYRVPFPRYHSRYPGGLIFYCWGRSSPPRPCNLSGVYLNDDDSSFTTDRFCPANALTSKSGGCSGRYVDVADQLGGKKNIVGKASHDGVYFWFEFKKELDTGDGYHWAFKPGNTYGVQGVDGRLSLLFDTINPTWGQDVTFSFCPCGATTSTSPTTALQLFSATEATGGSQTLPSQPFWVFFASPIPFGTFGLAGVITVAAVSVASSFLVVARRRKRVGPSVALQLKKAPEAPAPPLPARKEEVLQQPTAQINPPTTQLVTLKPPETLVQKPPIGPKPEPNIPTGYGELDRLLSGGLPEGYAVVFVSPSYDERDLLLRKIIESALNSGRTTFYMSGDIATTKDLVGSYHKGFFAFSSQADKIASALPNLQKIPEVQNLSDLNISMSKAISALQMPKTAGKLIIVDILSDVLLHHKALTTRRWLADFVAKRKAEGFTIVCTINPLITKDDTQTVTDLFDGIIEIYEKELKERTRRFIMIRKMHALKYSDTELMLDKDKLF